MKRGRVVSFYTSIDGGEYRIDWCAKEARDYSVVHSETKTVNVAANDNEVEYALAA